MDVTGRVDTEEGVMTQPLNRNTRAEIGALSHRANSLHGLSNHALVLELVPDSQTIMCVFVSNQKKVTRLPFFVKFPK